MRDLDGVLNDIESLVEERLRIQGALARLSRSGLSPGLEEERRRKLQDEDRDYREWCKRELARLTTFPPQHGRHAQLLSTFWSAGSYESSVFIMTKFPEGSVNVKDQELEKLLTAISDAIRQSGYMPRVARSPSNYHPALWDNVELHLLGCRQGIAVVEDKYLNELNPNVAMEWGWMRAMGKPVLYLVEKDFKNFRADLGGLLNVPFSWDDPATAASAVKPWLQALAATSP
jgi:hypothetical protein